MLSKTQTLFGETILELPDLEQADLELSDSEQDDLEQADLQQTNKQQLLKLLQHYSQEEAAARIAIYKNNFYRSLIDILLDTFASIHQLIGSKHFEYLAKQFISQQPPTNPSVALYGANFPAFLAIQELSQQLPYIADCASFDWALHCAYYKKDAAPIAAEEFLEIDPQQLMQCQLEFHPATQLLQSNYSIFSIREFLNSNEQAEQIHFDEPETVLICRNQYKVEHYVVEAASGIFINYLMQHANLEQAISDTMAQCAEFNPSQAIGFLIQTQCIITIQGVK